jgi:hypothetical protein
MMLFEITRFKCTLNTRFKCTLNTRFKCTLNTRFKCTLYSRFKCTLNTRFKCTLDRWFHRRILFFLLYKHIIIVKLGSFNATFNNIAVISWGSVLLVEETGGSWENHQPVARHWQTLSHNVVSSTPRHERDSNSQI